MNIFILTFHKNDKAFASDLYLIYNRSPAARVCKSDTDRLLMLYLVHIDSNNYIRDCKSLTASSSCTFETIPLSLIPFSLQKRFSVILLELKPRCSGYVVCKTSAKSSMVFPFFDKTFSVIKPSSVFQSSHIKLL